MVGSVIKYGILGILLFVATYYAGLPLVAALLLAIVLGLLGIFGVLTRVVDLSIVTVAFVAVALIAIAEISGMPVSELIRTAIDTAKEAGKAATSNTAPAEPAATTPPAPTTTAPAAPATTPATQP